MPVIPSDAVWAARVVIPSEAAKRRSRGIAIVPSAMSRSWCRVQKRTQISQITRISQIGAFARTGPVCAICERAQPRPRDLRRLLGTEIILDLRPR